MPHYIAEIQFNRTSKDVKSERKVKKRPVTRLITILLACLLVLTPIFIVPSAVGSDQTVVIEALNDLCNDVSELPEGADGFKNSRAAEGQRKALCNKIHAVIHKVEAGAYESAVNKLTNDIKKHIMQWVNDQFVKDLLDKVDDIIYKITDKEPPVIVDVRREPETPAYNETVTVKANVTDAYVYTWRRCFEMQWGEHSQTLFPINCMYTCRMKSVILSYSIDETNWENVTMEKIGELYVGEIPAFPYGTTVNYKIYAYDKAGNFATTGPESYTVIDPYPPTISNVNHSPLSPSPEETVSVSAEVTEPVNASGVELVILSYLDVSDWTNVTMTIEGMLYKGTTPALPNGTTVQYKILARDYAGNWAASDIFSYTVWAIPPPLFPPIAEFTESEEVVDTLETIFFDASNSYDPDGAIVSYDWDFGDGAFANGVITSHSYADDGIYTVTLTVTDNDGATDSTSAVKTVLNRPPVALFNESAEIVDTGVAIMFNASDSYDLDGEIVSYYWDFGDSATEIYMKDTNLTAIASHSYADNGTYTVTLTVTDDDNSSNSTNAVKIVKNRPPVAEFTQSVADIKTEKSTRFDAGLSYDPDGTIESYFWDFGDGTNATGVEVIHSYEDDGSYIVTLTVTDDDGATNSKNITKTVLNRQPIALFTANETEVDVGETILFNASDSFDPDGDVVEYFWDFGDGTNETGMIVDHTYNEAGNYTVTLTVTDDDGAIDTDTDEITVNALPEIPWALFAVLGLSIIAAAATLIYLWYRRRKRKKTAKTTMPPTKPAVTLYLPAKILAEHEKSS